MYLRESLEEVRAQKDKLENPVTPLCPLIKTENIYEEGKTGILMLVSRIFPILLLRWPNKSKILVTSLGNQREYMWRVPLMTGNVEYFWQLLSPMVPNSTGVD